MKLLTVLFALVPGWPHGKQAQPESPMTDAFDASLVLPTWEEHPRAREFRRSNEPDILRDYYHFR